MVAQKPDLIPFGVESSDKCDWTTRIELNNFLRSTD